ncbi:MAG: hypothetical protein JWM93_1178 [Frankiales bacterium]|nr:hypothetical protein [Frankiales bacterium]
MGHHVVNGQWPSPSTGDVSSQAPLMEEGNGTASSYDGGHIACAVVALIEAAKIHFFDNQVAALDVLRLAGRLAAKVSCGMATHGSTSVRVEDIGLAEAMLLITATMVESGEAMPSDVTLDARAVASTLRQASDALDSMLRASCS